jgi:hypothetical protein
MPCSTLKVTSACCLLHAAPLLGLNVFKGAVSVPYASSPVRPTLAAEVHLAQGQFVLAELTLNTPESLIH